MSEKVTILCASGYGKDYNPSELMRKSAGRGIRTPAAPRGHKLLGPLKGGSPGLLPAWLGDPGTTRLSCFAFLLYFSF